MTYLISVFGRRPTSVSTTVPLDGIMFGILVTEMLLISVTYGGIVVGKFTCDDGFKCIPLSECKEVRAMVDNDSLLGYARYLMCGYFHEPYVCCIRDCTTITGSHGRTVPWSECNHLEKLNPTSGNRQEAYMDDFRNDTHVCCDLSEDAYKTVPPLLTLPNDSTTCTTPNGETEKCIHASECDAYKEKMVEIDENFRFVNDSFCGYWREPMICCGEASDYKENYISNLPNNEDCGLWDSTVDPKIPPWLALITSKAPSRSCIGALINHEYVLGTVGCIAEDYRSLNIKFGGCINDESRSDCSFQAVDSKIFPLYRYLRSEDVGVALLKLNEPVSSMRGFMPVCLPTTELGVPGSISVVALEKTISAWVGNIVTTSTIFNDDCNLPSYLRIICMKNDFVCRDFKQLLQNFVLEFNSGHWYLQGLFNKENCHGSMNDFFHAIYVYKFVSWIRSNVS